MKGVYISCLIVALSYYMTDCSTDVSASEGKASMSATGFIDNSKALFEKKCAMCHGSDGTAGIANATNLKLSKANMNLVIQTITSGKNVMPAFKNQLSTNEIAEVARYVGTLRK